MIDNNMTIETIIHVVSIIILEHFLEVAIMTTYIVDII